MLAMSKGSRFGEWKFGSVLELSVFLCYQNVNVGLYFERGSFHPGGLFHV